MPRKPKQEPVKYCQHCGMMMARQRFAGRLEDMARFRKRRYCDRKCMAAAYEGTIKNPNPRNFHRQSAKATKGSCEACGKRTTLHVHHADENPMNNSPSNLRTLCAKCHREAHSPNFSEPGARRSCLHCSRPAMKKGLCWTHNTRYRKYGDPLMTKVRNGSSWHLIREAGS